jgi:hypothetical protein
MTKQFNLDEIKNSSKWTPDKRVIKSFQCQLGEFKEKGEWVAPAYRFEFPKDSPDTAVLTNWNWIGQNPIASLSQATKILEKIGYTIDSSQTIVDAHLKRDD